MQPTVEKNRCVVVSMKCLALMLTILSPCLVFADDQFAEDQIGDLNRPYVEPGDFQGAIKVTGERGVPVSIAVGGFVKVLALHDNNSEREDVYFRPSLLAADDNHGRTQIKANMSRFFLDSRSNFNQQTLQAYFEGDFYEAPDIRLRQAYLKWKNESNMLLAGLSWSTLMDISAFPEIVYETAPAGGTLVRQAQLRFSRRLAASTEFSIALEDPSNSDLALAVNQQSLNTLPEIASNLRWQVSRTIHFQLGALVRQLAVEHGANQETDKSLALGGHLSAVWTEPQHYKWTFSYLYGDGIGRYIIGSTPESGITDAQGRIKKRGSQGGYLSYQQFLTQRWRTNITTGFSKAETFETETGVFQESFFITSNVLYHVNDVLNMGIEVSYGKSTFIGEARRDNTRLSLVMQLY